MSILPETIDAAIGLTEIAEGLESQGYALEKVISRTGQFNAEPGNCPA